MKNFFLSTLVCSAALATASAQVNVDVFSGHTTTGGGSPYSGLAGSFTSPDIMFATDTSFAWHPFGLDAFGADITGHLNVTAAASYAFTLNSDDGSLLFIDGIQVINDGGPHSPGAAGGSIDLTPGCHRFEVQFFEDFGGPSGVDLTLPTGVTYATPEVASTGWLLAGAFTMLGALGRRIRK